MADTAVLKLELPLLTDQASSCQDKFTSQTLALLEGIQARHKSSPAHTLMSHVNNKKIIIFY